MNSFLLILSFCAFISSSSCLTMENLILPYGYTVETHEVTTDDGYILTMFRIPSKKEGAPPVLFQHCLSGSSLNWFGNEKDSLGFLASNAGYDVWFGNNRGNIFSINHTKLTKNDRKYWDFYVHELGIYDLPAEIDYILEKTSKSSLSYVGHSQGCAQYLIMTSEKPNYAAKVNSATFLAPCVFHKDSSSILFRLSYLASIINNGPIPLNANGIEGVIPVQLITALCKTDYFNSLCSLFIYIYAGYDHGITPVSKASTVFKQIPAGSSSKEYFYWGQGTHYGVFGQYNYGKSENIKLYKSETPPEYDLTKNTAPIFLLYASNDAFVSVENVQRLLSKLPSDLDVKSKMINRYNHFNFYFGKNAKSEVYDDIIEFLNTKNP